MLQPAESHPGSAPNPPPESVFVRAVHRSAHAVLKAVKMVCSWGLPEGILISCVSDFVSG